MARLARVVVVVLGHPYHATQRGNAASMSYDADRRLLTTTAPAPFGAGSPALVQTSNAYDPDGHLLSVTRTNAAGNAVTSMTYTATGQVQAVTDPNGNVTTNSYDADDRLASVTDPLYRQTVYGYDAMSRRISVSNPAIQSTPLLQQSYTPDGLIASLTDANGNTTTFAPDGFDRLATTTYPGGNTEVLGYDADGNVLSRKTRAGATIVFTYDTLNRLATKAPPSEAAVTYVYDLDSHLIGVGDNSATITTPAASASYAENLAYDQLNRPLSANWSPAPAQTTPTTASATFGFAYDPTNRRIGQSATDNSWWSYPATAAKVSYTANSLNQYTAVGSVTPSYDGNGNLTSDGTFAYCYDAENRLASIVSAGTCASPTTTLATYAYDAQGRRKSKTVGGTTTIYVTDADNREVLEYNGSSGAVNNWYSFAPAAAFGPDAVLNQMNVASGTRETLIPDIQSSIIGALDAVSGTLTKTGYQAYGENPSLTSGSFQYTARRFDPETAGSVSQPCGLYYYRSRAYSPCWGRFLQVDSIGYAGGSNLYAYVGNDPLDGVDPTALLTLQLGIAGGGTVLGFLVPQGGFGIVFDTHGNIGIYQYGGLGVGIGLEAQVGVSVQFSNAETIYDLSNRFNNTSLQFGGGLGGSLDYFTGNSPNGPVLGGGVTFGASTGASASLTQTTTQICGSLGCVGPLSGLSGTSIVSPAVADVMLAQPQSIVSPAAADVTSTQPQSTSDTSSGLSTQPGISPTTIPTEGQTPSK